MKSGSNYQRTAAWLHACGKTPTVPNLSVQIGCHIEEFIEFLECIDLDATGGDRIRLDSIRHLRVLAEGIKRGASTARIPDNMRAYALDALCDNEVTGNGIAYLAGFDKEAAYDAVLSANEAKLVDGKPVILEGGKIGKPEGWKPPDLSGFV